MAIDIYENALNAQTDMEKLKACQVDLRLRCLGLRGWLKLRYLPGFFVVKIHVKDQLINIYVNQWLGVVNLILQLLSMKVLTEEEALYSYLETSGEKRIIELHDPFRYELYDIEVIVKQRAVIVPDLTIVLKTVKEQTYRIQASSVCMLKCRMQFKYDISVDMQVLLFRGITLNDERKLGEYGISNNSTLFLRLLQMADKPVIRLRSTTGQSISNVNVHLQLDNIWKLSCIYPEPTNTEGASFVQWNHIEVFPDGHMIMKQKHQANANCLSRHYPSIDDEVEYPMLFWEALTNDYSSFDIDNGLRVPRVDFPRVFNYLLKKNIVFRFLSPNEYFNVAELKIRPEPDRIIRAFLLYRLSNEDDEQIATSTMEELENEVKKVLGSIRNHQSSGLLVHE